MHSQKKESSAGRAFRLAPCAKGQALVGVAAAVAVGAFAFLVFGPVADQRAVEMAGYFAVPVAVEAPVRAQPAAPWLAQAAVPLQFYGP